MKQATGTMEVRLNGLVDKNSYDSTLNQKRFWNEFATLTWLNRAASIKMMRDGSTQITPANLLQTAPHVASVLSHISLTVESLPVPWPTEIVLHIGLDTGGGLIWTWPVAATTEEMSKRDARMKQCLNLAWDWPYENLLICAASIAVDLQSH